ncbi:MAG: bifunctional aldolase/short-chain dehydrogenase [Verrucomicrobiales bacterium]|nr:bifunctional aldolase/short-chain dehydrogenase [Verrucomicrobiales bacterium]
MQSRWSDSEALNFPGELGLRLYTSRLLGADPALVMHGGGNTSVKIREKDFFGDEVDVLHVKGSGGDLATITEAGFAPVRLAALLKMGRLESLSDADMVAQQRAAMLNPAAPNPSIEAVVHAVIPAKYVDHTHADSVLALTNHQNGLAAAREVYGDRVLVLPYVMPGFVLAKQVAEALSGIDPSKIDGMILMNPGIFTWHDDPRRSYELMIELVSLAEDHLAHKTGGFQAPVGEARQDLSGLATLRKAVSAARGKPCLALLDDSPEAVGFSNRTDAASLATRGPLTPDHTIRTKRLPAVVTEDPVADIAAYAAEYEKYFAEHSDGRLTMLDPAPRWAVWQGRGVVSFGTTETEAAIVKDIATHTWQTIQTAEAAWDGGWQPLPAKELFEIEYWELEQAKLRKAGGSPLPHQGKVALVTGSAAGIGFACAEALAKDGAKVIGLDLNPDIVAEMEGLGGIGMVVNLTDDAHVIEAISETVRRFGGIDIVVSNAGIFTAGAYLEDMEQSNWDKSMAVNLTSHQKLLKYTIPYLKEGSESAVVLVGSRNAKAPGPGAASYSCAKAALTQLCRVAALELAPTGVRCNIIHPDAVFDTKLWTPEALQRSAERYGMTVDEYKKRNLMKTEIRSRDVGRMVSAMASSLFGKTTGAQIPVDGGNDRVI